ncbi:MAG: MCE family protein [Rhodospirillales bacterium]|nr:MCE family protein [Rhodospirillales bacterium]
MMARDTKEILVGFGLLIGLVLAIALSYGSRGYTGTGYVVTGVFNRVDGLVIGNTVTISGVRVGSVEHVTLDKDYRALVAIRLDPGVQLPSDSDAAVHTDGLFGRKFVVLGPGGDTKMFAGGERITYTQGSVLVDDLLEQIIAEGKSRQRKGAASTKEGS